MRRFTFACAIAFPIFFSAACAPDDSSPLDEEDVDEQGATSACAALPDPVYARVRPAALSALYTTNASEAASAGPKYGYTQDLGTPFFAKATAGTGLSPVYRLYNSAKDDFLWTLDANERASSIAKYGYADGAPAFYASATPQTCFVPIYRYLNSARGKHRFAVTQADRTALEASGFVNEGIKLYGAPAASAPPPPPPPPAPEDKIASALNGLDGTGKTIPDSNYTVPSGAIFISTSGNDANSGTQAAPVKTLNRAVALLPSAGGTIVVRGGTDASPAIFRDWYYSNNATLGKTFGVVGKSITLQAYPHEKAWFDGTDVIPTASWAADGAGHYSLPWSTPSFCGTLPTATQSNYYKVSLDAQRTTANGPCGFKDSSLDPTNPMAIDPQMVFVDGTYIHQVATLAEATGNNFYYDWSQRRLYLGTNPSGHTVEVAARPMAMQLNGAGSKVLGLGFRRYASHQYPNNTGVIYAGAANQTFENLVFTAEAGLSLMFGVPRGSIVNRSIFANSGGAAIGGSGSNTTNGSATQDNFVIQNSIFSKNNTEKFWTNCTYSCGASAIKLTKMVGFTIQKNLIENTQGQGLGAWCDMGCTGGKYLYNVVRNNGGTGLIDEISDKAIFASNLVYGNVGAGIRLCSAHSKIYNNTVVNNGKGGSYIQGNVWVYDDPRSVANPDTANTGASLLGPDTVNIEYANNVLESDNRINNISGTSTAYTNTVPSKFFDVLDNNAYFRSAGATQVLTHWAAPGSTVDYKTVASFTAAHSPLDAHSVDLSSGAEPFFVNATSNDYRLRSGHQAGTGRAIPADVVTALGISSGTGLAKGALSWPGRQP